MKKCLSSSQCGKLIPGKMDRLGFHPCVNLGLVLGTGGWVTLPESYHRRAKVRLSVAQGE